MPPNSTVIFCLVFLHLILRGSIFASCFVTNTLIFRGRTSLQSRMKGTEGFLAEKDMHLAESREAFIEWAVQHAIPINSIQPSQSGGDAENQSDPFLLYLSGATSSAKVVLLSEGFHNCKEMMSLHHRIIQHLISKCNFQIVASESGLPESRDITEYLASVDTNYSEEEKEMLWKNGINKMYSAWVEGRDLVEWMREYNVKRKLSAQDDMISYCGLDIGGFYSDWNYPISKVQDYLKIQCPDFEEQWSSRIQPLLKVMGTTKARYNHQHLLTAEQKLTLSVLLDELVLELHSHKELQGDNGYEWAKQSAISMQLTENYYRNYENMMLSDSGNGISKYSGLDGREIAMSNNMMWRLNLGDEKKEARMPNSEKKKMVVINHIIHTKTATQYQDGVWGHFVPMGQHMKQMLESEQSESGVAMFNIGMLYGRLSTFWNKWQRPQERYVDTSPEPKEDGLEVVMKEISKQANVSNFFLHWELAPKEAWLFLNEVTSIRENEYFIKAYPLEWNGCIYLDEVSHATPP